MVAKIGAKAPNLQISRWVQGKPTNIDKEKGNVVLVEVFQVNCPGCFLYGIPEAIDIYKKYKDQGLTVLGMATAFEDYDKNTLENLQKLVTTGEVIGETYRALAQYGQLMDGNKIPYKIPFPVGMDMLKKESGQMMTDSKVMDFIEANIPDFRSYSEKDRQLLVERVKQYLRSKEYSAKTFEEYALRGTPSSILVDRKGILRSTFFGSNGFLEDAVEELLKE
ncbi:MAG: TlpA family protein disulfide reductase [Nitrososphaera sp.]